ncbi:hypothetical protein AB840_01975 [Megasphaera cerevisiae DSM 20462]|jgi:hypothetical protein|uniref:Uncharacterized protein n=1 Tax=Megasphaera cerevisiae DSM 20462 TaxID=1122219 RepID=A0A0J6WVH5_9FIRM|nr:hypothetical protein [Megasphaera cerevisiae]KMO87505.1 hypothetical protein AB840_01975 [Megasphaera cerevisiae DSM 20462]OKY54255.1 hypothetical protein BSR42_02950 [Megasphaera cerevisiae]SJZ51874.1 hypothetical protein SAMN05660900_00657 [Megasphaera cerevisiae DSM 20462]
MRQAPLADIWGDTVDLHHLGIGVIIGIVISISCYLGASTVIAMQAPNLEEKLVSAYSLLFGIGGCVLSAVISANLFKPKRTLNEAEFSEEDRDRVLQELKIDLVKEREELQYVDAKVLQEMKELKLYELFAGPAVPEGKGENAEKRGET